MRAARMAQYMMANRNSGDADYRYGADTGEMENRQRYPRRKDGTFRPRNTRTYEYDAEYNNEYEAQNQGGGGGGGRMNMIGFGDRNEMESNYGARMESHFDRDEMSNRNSMKQGGGAHSMSSRMKEGMTKDIARMWVKSMKHADGGRGEHWSMEQVMHMAKEKGVDVDPIELYAIMNALYADYCTVFQKHGVASPEFYLDMSRAWIEDSDAVEDKVAMYYECIVKH